MSVESIITFGLIIAVAYLAYSWARHFRNSAKSLGRSAELQAERVEVQSLLSNAKAKAKASTKLTEMGTIPSMAELRDLAKTR